MAKKLIGNMAYRTRRAKKKEKQVVTKKVMT